MKRQTRSLLLLVCALGTLILCGRTASAGTVTQTGGGAHAKESLQQTFAIETYMRRAYNYLDNMTDESGRPYFDVLWFQGEKPAMAIHGGNDCPDVTSRQWQAAIFARHMTGRQCRNETVWAKTILARMDPKTGLLDPSITPYMGGNHGLVLYALATAWADSKDPVYRDAACRMIAHLPGVYNPKDQWSGFQLKSIMTWVRLFNDKSGLEYAGTLARARLDSFGAANHFGGHMHCGLRALSGIADYALYVKDEAMLARVDALYRDARSKGTRFGWLPENVLHASEPVGDQVGAETCALMDFVCLATTLANNGHPEYWGDVERMLRNQLAESQVADGSWLKPGDKPDTQLETWRDVGSRMVGGWAGWSSPTHIWSNGSGSKPTKAGGFRAFQNCCGGSGDTALFTAWKNASLFEDGVLSVNMHFDKLLPQAEIRCHQPYQGYLSVALKEACKVRIRVPDFVEAKDVKVSSNKGEVQAAVENGYLELGPRQAGEKIEVTYPVPVKEEEIAIGNPGHKQFHYRVTWKGDTVVRMTPIGEQCKTIHSGYGKETFDVEAYYGEEGPGRLYQREYMLSDVVPQPSPLCMDDGKLNFWKLTGLPPEADTLTDSIQTQVGRNAEAALAARAKAQAGAPQLDAFRHLVRVGNWTEFWPDAAGEPQPRAVTGEVWTAALQAALDGHNTVTIPARPQPYYLDAPLVLKPGQSLTADAKAEIRLLPNINTCMIRNEHIVGAQTGSAPDRDIVIEGGIWTTLATAPGQCNGNSRGRSAKQNGVHGCHGVILLNNVCGVAVRNVTIRQSRAFGVHLSNCSDFLVEGVTFEDQGRDGVHVNGPAAYGVIRNVRGVTHDDFVALNAWEWANYAPSYGPIHHVLVEDVSGSARAAGDLANPFPDGTAEIRLLPGTKTFADGTKLACDISDCVFRKLTDIRTVKAYDQPNLELGRDKDFCNPIGTLRNVFFSQLTFNRPGRFPIAANVEGLMIDDVELRFVPSDSFRLVEIGPMSATYKHKPEDPATWTEIFSPDRDVTVRAFRLSNVRVLEGGQSVPFPDASARLVKVADQKPNPDYPKTTPRGGVGKVFLFPY